jgi:hypothetical protein
LNRIHFDEEEKEDVGNLLNRLSHSAPRLPFTQSEMIEERKTLTNGEIMQRLENFESRTIEHVNIPT